VECSSAPQNQMVEYVGASVGALLNPADE